MSAAGDRRTTPTYVFGPLERRGLVGGVRTTQFLVVFGSFMLGVAALRTLPRVVAGVAFLTVLAVGGLTAFLEVRERTADEWAVLAIRYATRVRTRQRHGAVGAYAEVLPTVRILDDPELHYGVLRERLSSFDVGWSAVLQVRGRPFALKTADDQAPILNSFGMWLATFCREGGAVRRVQTINRTVRTEAVSHHAYVLEHGDTTSPFFHDYVREQFSHDPPLDHESFVVVQVSRSKARRQIDRRGGGDVGGLAVLRDEVERVRHQLRELLPGGAALLTPRGVADVLRTAYDPSSRNSDHESSPEAISPAFEEERFGCYCTAGSAHATLWVRNLPRIPVGPSFLLPMLLETRAPYTFSVTYAPLPPGAAMRRAEAARTADVGDATVRARYGFVDTARKQSARESTERLTEEQAAGHQTVEFSAYITVTSPDVEQMERDLAEVEARARQCLLETSRCYGEQAEAFTFTLPLARGLN